TSALSCGTTSQRELRGCRFEGRELAGFDGTGGAGESPLKPEEAKPGSWSANCEGSANVTALARASTDRARATSACRAWVGRCDGSLSSGSGVPPSASVLASRCASPSRSLKESPLDQRDSACGLVSARPRALYKASASSRAV